MLTTLRQFVILGVLLTQLLLVSRAVEAQQAAAQQWATISGKFVVDGKVAAPAVLTCNKDESVCCVTKPIDESVVVNAQGELANVFVYVRSKIALIHPDVQKAALATIVVVDNKNCVFSPHAQYMWNQQTLELKNSDNVGHNANISSIHFGWSHVSPPSGSTTISLKHKLDKSDTIPAELVCNVHPWMKARLLIRDNPYGTVSAADGSFKIEKIPAGEVEFVIWHEKIRYLSDTKIKDTATDLKGRFTLNLTADVDLGTIKISADKLK